MKTSVVVAGEIGYPMKVSSPTAMAPMLTAS